MSDKNIKKTVSKLLVVVVGMFAFGYALVPLYEAYCDLTGRGSDSATSAAAVAAGDVDENRLVTVALDTNTRDIPWTFKAGQHKIKVRPGELSEAVFIVQNQANRPVTGRAIPSVSPTQAGVYLSKTECFCFVEQVLAPGERREMQVRFVVDADLPERFSSLTLSYTFFSVDSPVEVAARRKILEPEATNS